MTSAEDQPPPDRTEAAKARLAEAVARLERALRARSGGTSDAADVEALRSVNATVADRLDGAIERLQTILEK